MDKKELLLQILRKEQKNNGYISESALKKISRKTDIPISRVYGVATFYSMLHDKKQGKNIIYACDTTSCHVNGSKKIIKYLEKKLKIKAGNTTKNKKFSLYTTSCIGCCDEAPAMLLNGKAYTKLTKEKIDDIIKIINKKIKNN